MRISDWSSDVCSSDLGPDGAVDALLLATKSGPRAVRGRVFIDCSGDADIAHWTGLPFEKGDGQGSMMYPTLMFKVCNVDGERARDAWKIIPQLMDDAEASEIGRAHV